MALARAAIRLEIPLVLAIPFYGQEDRWGDHAKRVYRAILEKAVHIEVVSEGSYTPEKMLLRNHWMVDHADRVLALWDGGARGGTYECVKYAMRNNKPVEVCWDRWKTYCDDARWLDLL